MPNGLKQLKNPFANRQQNLPDTGAFNMTATQLDELAKASGYTGANTRGSSTSQMAITQNTNTMRPAGDSFSKADPVGTTQNIASGNPASTSAELISKNDAVALSTNPSQLQTGSFSGQATNYGMGDEAGHQFEYGGEMETIKLSDGTTMAVPAGNVSIDHKTNAVTQLSTVDQEYKPSPGSQVQDVPIYAETSTNLAPGEVREEMKGFLSDEDLLATMQPQSDQPSFSELYNKSRAYDTPAGFDKSIGDFDPSMGNKLLNQSGLGTTGKKLSLIHI